MGLMTKISRVLQNKPEIIQRKIINKLPRSIKGKVLRFPKESVLKKQILDALEGNEGKIFIFPAPSCPWGYMFQRPQQIARALAKEGHIVFYMIDTSFPYEPDWYVRGLLEVEPNLYLFNDNNNGTTLIKSCANEQVFIWQYWPHQLNTISNWEGLYTNIFKIYDCIDYIDTFDTYDNILKDFEKSVEECDCLLATAKSIKKDLSKFNKDVLYLPNAVTIEDFVDYDLFDWSELEKVKIADKKIIGYYGAIAEWFDFETVKYMAKSNPDWTIVLVGEVYPTVEKQVEELKQTGKVEVLKRVSYNKIPHLLSLFDVAILPFLINEITLSTSPVKVFEYLAGGKCVVSTPLPEVLEIEGVFIGNSKEEFERQVKAALCIGMEKNHVEMLRKVAEQHTWQKRVRKINEII
ncbi:glycosyltransferase [Lysinibacillus sp. NPDC096212]|uniref:glycosyltransferase n=1 Tax=Lysinibacillus sp. NPDC096212 TaxID=3364135 RepID=UPI0037F32F6E